MNYDDAKKQLKTRKQGNKEYFLFLWNMEYGRIMNFNSGKTFKI